MKKWSILFPILIVFLSSCGSYLNQPTQIQSARFGEETRGFEYIIGLKPDAPIVVGVYKFKDQTGQYKASETGINYSTAVTQGATTILLKSLEDSKWFIPIERENISNLLNERQIIRSTRLEESQKNSSNAVQELPPLLFAGVLLEGGIISYDTNIITGGVGLKYFGAGASTQYRQDRITVYLRAISTSSGKIIKTVYISKTLLSQAIDVSLFRYVKLRRLLEVETGISQNEPTQLAVKDAIDMAVESLIIEGLKEGVWKAASDPDFVSSIIDTYDKDKAISDDTRLFDRERWETRDHKKVVFHGYTSLFNGDYSNSNVNFGADVGFNFLKKRPYWNFNQTIGAMYLENTNIFKDYFFTFGTNIEYTILPYDKVSPYVWIGGGGLFNSDDNLFHFKGQAGIGIELLRNKKMGFSLFAEQNLFLKDDLDGMIYGKYNDKYWKFGFNVNLYIK
jgi:curli production assembly/transport component CsgG